MSGYGFVRVHDAWMLDGDLAQLMAAGRHDAVCLFFALIAHSHAHDTDGSITEADRSVLERLCNITTDDAFRSLIATRKIVKERGGRGGSTLRIRTYERWQTTRDQREQNSERMRLARAPAPARAGDARAATRASKREKRARAPETGVHVAAADAGLPLEGDAADDGMDERYRYASEYIAKVNGDG